MLVFRRRIACYSWHETEGSVWCADGLHRSGTSRSAEVSMTSGKLLALQGARDYRCGEVDVVLDGVRLSGWFEVCYLVAEQRALLDWPLRLRVSEVPACDCLDRGSVEVVYCGVRIARKHRSPAIGDSNGN